MKWQPKSDGFIVALWGLFTPFSPPLGCPKASLRKHNSALTPQSLWFPDFSPIWWGVQLKDYKDLYAIGKISSTMKTQVPLVVFMAGQIRIASVGIAGVGPLGVSSRPKSLRINSIECIGRIHSWRKGTCRTHTCCTSTSRPTALGIRRFELARNFYWLEGHEYRLTYAD